MSKHTPGPWKVAKPSRSHANGNPMYGLVGPEIVADYEDWGFTEANARLIAAAPDLLEALKEANKELEYLNDPKGFVSMRQERIMEKARAAIAKASGSAT